MWAQKAKNRRSLRVKESNLTIRGRRDRLRRDGEGEGLRFDEGIGGGNGGNSGVE